MAIKVDNLAGRLAALTFRAALAVFAASATAYAGSPSDVTQGGVRQGSRVLTVTSLEDSGPGTFRDAVTQKGPRVVVFAVGGLVTLKSDIDVVQPELSVLGQSAPDPGVTLTGASIRIRTRDVALEHLAIYSATSGDPKVDVARDSLAVIGLANKKAAPHGVLLRNLSLGWAPDENLSIVGERVSNVMVSDSLIAEGLARSAHPKPDHSAGVLIGPGSKSVTLYRNLLVSNQFRNPQVQRGSSVRIINNVIYNAERAVVYLDGDKSNDAAPASIDIASNVVIPGQFTKCGVYFISFTKKRLPSYYGSRIAITDNLLDKRDDGDCHRDLIGVQPLPGSGLDVVDQTSPITDALSVLPARSVETSVLEHAGTRPSRRSAIDRRIVASVSARGADPFDAPRDVAELSSPSAVSPSQALAEAVDLPKTIRGEADVAAVASFRCARHLAVGGQPSGGCPR